MRQSEGVVEIIKNEVKWTKVKEEKWGEGR
jgi:hypothetical protein